MLTKNFVTVWQTHHVLYRVGVRVRPSLAPQRRAEMLEAVAACVAEVGIQGLTTERVASQAGWTRGHVRHYLGNKDDQLAALVQLMIERYATSLQDATDAAPAGSRRDVILDTLFGAPWQSERQRDDIVLDQLVAYESLNPTGSVAIRSMYQQAAETISAVLQSESPQFTESSAHATAFVLISLAYGTATMKGLGWDDGLAVARAHARGLLHPPGEAAHG